MLFFPKKTVALWAETNFKDPDQERVSTKRKIPRLFISAPYSAARAQNAAIEEGRGRESKFANLSRNSKRAGGGRGGASLFCHLPEKYARRREGKLFLGAAVWSSLLLRPSSSSSVIFSRRPSLGPSTEEGAGRGGRLKLCCEQTTGMEEMRRTSGRNFGGLFLLLRRAEPKTDFCSLSLSFRLKSKRITQVRCMFKKYLFCFIYFYRYKIFLCLHVDVLGWDFWAHLFPLLFPTETRYERPFPTDTFGGAARGT